MKLNYFIEKLLKILHKYFLNGTAGKIYMTTVDIRVLLNKLVLHEFLLMQ